MADPLPKNQRRAMQLAGAALTAALANDWDRATRMLQRVGDECGPEGVERAMLGLCDTVISRSGITPGRPVQIAFQQVDGDGRVTGADEVPRPEVVWAGRMMAARAAEDQDTWTTLIEALPDDGKVFGRHVGALLEMSALMIARAMRGGA